MGKVETRWVKYFDGEERQIDIYLPKNYKKRECKIIYFHDGQNLYFHNRATYGTSWGIKRICEQKDYPFIIVGIYSGGLKRCNEYSPFRMNFPPAEIARPQWNKALGDDYASWIVEELMPYISKEYSITHTFDNTAVCGSSLGGVMSSYMASKYSDIFKYIGVYSLASWYNEKAHLDYIRQNPLNKNQYYYIYVGTNESSVQGAVGMNLEYLSNAKNYEAALLELGIDKAHYRKVVGEGEQHCEASWNRYIDDFFQIMNKN